MPTVKFFDLSQTTRSNAGTEITVDELPEGETFVTAAGAFCVATKGLLCLAAGASAKAVLSTRQSAKHVLASLSDGTVAIMTKEAAASPDTLSAGIATGHIVGFTQAEFLAGGEMIVTAGVEGSMAIWTVC